MSGKSLESIAMLGQSYRKNKGGGHPVDPFYCRPSDLLLQVAASNFVTHLTKPSSKQRLIRHSIAVNDSFRTLRACQQGIAVPNLGQVNKTIVSGGV